MMQIAVLTATYSEFFSISSMNVLIMALWVSMYFGLKQVGTSTLSTSPGSIMVISPFLIRFVNSSRFGFLNLGAVDISTSPFSLFLNFGLVAYVREMKPPMLWPISTNFWSPISLVRAWFSSSAKSGMVYFAFSGLSLFP